MQPALVVMAPRRINAFDRELRHRVRLAIEAAEIPKQDIARQMRVLPSRISRYLGEEHTINVQHGVTLCRVLGVRLAWLFGGELPMYEAARPIASIAARDRQAQRDQQRKKARTRRAG